MPARRSRSAGARAAPAREGRSPGAESGMARRRADRRRSPGRNSDDRWQSILEAGSRVFRRLGYGQATLEDVARELGINRATLYYYVADKAELLVAILEEPVQRMTRELGEIRGMDAPSEEKLRRAIAYHMQALEENYPELFVFFAENLHMLPVKSGQDLQRNAEGYGDHLTAIVAEGVARGEFRGDLDARLVMLATVGMMNWSHRWYTPDSAMGLPEIGKQFAELVLDGLLARR